MSMFGREVTLSEVCSSVTYGYTASATDADTGTKFLRITDIVPNLIDWNNVPYCQIQSKDLEKYKLQIGDIVIARTGATTGWNKTIKSLPQTAVYASYLIKYNIIVAIADPFYVGYNLRTSQWYDYVDAIAGGSAQPGANAKQLGSYVFNLPPLTEQKAIALVLSSLDDKIDLLHRQNKTLESMAETLFRQWFVEKVQNEWEEVKLSEYVELNKSSINKNYVFKEIQYLDTSSLTKGIISELQLMNLSEAPSRAKRLVTHVNCWLNHPHSTPATA